MKTNKILWVVSLRPENFIKWLYLIPRLRISRCELGEYPLPSIKKCLKHCDVVIIDGIYSPHVIRACAEYLACTPNKLVVITTDYFPSENLERFINLIEC